MITLFLIILILSLAGGIVSFAIKASWSLIKIIFTAVLFPAVLIFLVIGGLVTFAVPIMIIAGIVLVIRGLTRVA